MAFNKEQIARTYHQSAKRYDPTESKLAKARQRVWRTHWNNTNLIQSEVAACRFPGHLDGILWTFALTLFAENDQVIQYRASALPAFKRCVIQDFNKPDKWPIWLIQAYAILPNHLASAWTWLIAICGNPSTAIWI